MSRSDLTSWGRFPRIPQTSHDVHWRAQLPRVLRDVADRFGTTLAYGAGRSYGDSCLAASDHVIDTRGMDRFIEADWERGLITAEAGTTLEQVLSVCIPRGWFLPVAPGTQHVTLGGALANDVHGKNHHVRGTFARHVDRFGLVRSDRGELQCSLQENADLYQASVGGLGLTGIISWVQLRLMPVHSSSMDVTEIRFGSVDDFFSLSAELDARHEYAVSWIDCLARGKSLGRGIYSVANHAPQGSLAAATSGSRLRVPMAPPVGLVNSLSLRVFNAAYYRRRGGARAARTVGYEPFLFPLDRIQQWNQLYGARGFQQFQCVLPERDARDSARKLLDAIATGGRGSFLAVLKRCGTLESPGLMSFPMPGVTLALDFPQHAELAHSVFPRLDAIVREAGGRLYPAKDAHMSAEDFRQGYPQWQRVEALRDPALNSRFWQRVTAA